MRVTDNGRPPLDDACTFKVLIEDINDNPPIFDKVRYLESMSEDITVGKLVMRISASDYDDGNNNVIEYEILEEKDYTYFRINKNNGLIYLTKSIDKKALQVYTIIVRAANIIPDYPQDSQIEVRIKVIESNKKPPQFINVMNTLITLKENYSDYSSALVTLQAMSNNPDKPELIFELITGRTEQTNKKKTFVFNQIGDTVTISLGKALDYETITKYSLTMSVKNSWDLVAEQQITVDVEDVNDNIPYFTEVTTGSISENELVGTPVMQVRAFDMDGTAPNNEVSYELADNTEYFTINSRTGNITALKTFDREERDIYNVKVIATDNSPSSLYFNNEPNRGQQVFKIEIADKNDHAPRFTNQNYIAHKLPEDANINFVVIEVTAVDRDDASQITYTIVNGNIDEAFKIESSTGKITVNSPLDYEKTTEYTLQIRANDGIFEDFATVIIRIENVNDNPPQFELDNYNTTIQEELVLPDCILNFVAYDPDIKDRTAPQNIKFFIVDTKQQSLLNIDDTGCLKLSQPLDRDEPNGFKYWQVYVAANDENGNGLRAIVDVIITLTDINDNAPFLTNAMPIIWKENQNGGSIVKLTARDYDEEINGPPFTYEIDVNANIDIRNKFNIEDGYLIATETFDREFKKEYFIPILIRDSGIPQMGNVSILHLIIGDENDNAMMTGVSTIFVYNYKGEAPDTEIGRVYVEDPDDWDLEDKTFAWKDGRIPEQFRLNSDDGMITMKEGTSSGQYDLYFTVTEESKNIKRHSVMAEVIVTVKEIPEEAVDKSGSIRFYGITAEEFVEPSKNGKNDGKSEKDRFQKSLATLLNITKENVDVFTVLKNENASIIDVRFSAHGSPYYEPLRLNGQIAQNQLQFEKELGLKMLMINIDECIIEKYKCESSCTNILHKSNVPLLIYTNTTSFVGVNAFIQAECVCNFTAQQFCLNGGTPFDKHCECVDGFEGPNCELINIGFNGDGFAMYPPISPCNSTKISLELSPNMNHGLVMYIGPLTYNPLLPLTDFLALELINGFPVLTVDYGTGAVRIEHKHIKLTTGKSYLIDILLEKTIVEMIVDNCKLSTCSTIGTPPGPNEFLNVNAPLQLGGASVNLNELTHFLNWSHIPTNGYHGCVRNLTIGGKTYNIGAPSISKNADLGCHRAIAVAISFGIDTNFLIAIIACIAVLLILLLAVVVHKKHHDGWHEKDMDDIRETIINYEDEGGGERDADYDLNVLRSPPMYEDKPYKEILRRKEPNEVPDIGGFLIDKKDTCDKDNDAHPVDDVRHYAYEGDGNSTGSLSSLASCTDDGDLKFDYLSNFGPRFRKLADMYGEEPSDSDSNVDVDEGWRI